MGASHSAGDGLFFALTLLLPVLTGAVLGLGVRRGWFAARSPRAARARAAAGNLLAALFILSLAHLAGECYFRFVHDRSDNGLTKAYRLWAARHYRYNSSGMRDDIEYEPDPAPGKRRILFLGDSFTVGHGVDVEQRFVNLIRRARADRWEVHAVAVPGMGTGEELRELRRVAADHRFSVVVLVYHLNDIEDLSPECQQMQRQALEELAREGPLVRHGFFINFMYYRWKSWREPWTARYGELLRDAYESAIWDRQQERLLLILAETERRGVPLLAVTFPVLDQLGERYPYRAAHGRLDALWRSHGVPHLDLLPVLEGRPPRELMVNRHDGHPSPLAHRLAAEAMISFFDATSSAPPPQPVVDSSHGRR